VPCYPKHPKSNAKRQRVSRAGKSGTRPPDGGTGDGIGDSRTSPCRTLESGPKGLQDGVNGVIVDTWQEMPAALERAEALDPDEQRRTVEERFSPQRMVHDYLAAYQTTINR
jgi:hypothetical protein